MLVCTLTLLFLLPQWLQPPLVKKLHTNKFGHFHSSKCMEKGLWDWLQCIMSYRKQTRGTAAAKNSPENSAISPWNWLCCRKKAFLYFNVPSSTTKQIQHGLSSNILNSKFILQKDKDWNPRQKCKPTCLHIQKLVHLSCCSTSVPWK